MKILIIILVFILSITARPFAQTEKCHRGTMINCPGLCGLFTDNNGDGYCDYSITDDIEDSQEDTNTSAENILNPTEQNNTTEDNQISEESDTTPTSVTSIDTTKETTETTITEEAIEETQASGKPAYPLWWISIATLISYFITSILVARGVMKKHVHRKIWNYILLVTFTVSGLLGLLLVVQINYDLMMGSYLKFLKLHVKFGIAMAIISIIHVIWHWKYYFSTKKQADC